MLSRGAQRSIRTATAIKPARTELRNREAVFVRNGMSAITKTIWMIERRIGAPVGLDDLALHAGMSRSHLSRIFPLATGFSISGYIRARRLTEAAKALATGAPDILAVAIDAGYGSHEAFTRAFREQFGLTPEDLRRRRSLDQIALVEALPMQSDVKVTLSPPIIAQQPAIQLAGLRQRQTMSQSNAIPSQWERFGAYFGNIPGEVSGPAYGVVESADDDTCVYVCALEVRGKPELPGDLVSTSIPAGRYARFTHRGHISTIRSTIHAIFMDWLPNSGLELAEGVNFVEYYGPDFEPSTGLGTTEIWLRLAQ